MSKLKLAITQAALAIVASLKETGIKADQDSVENGINAVVDFVSDGKKIEASEGKIPTTPYVIAADLIAVAYEDIRSGNVKSGLENFLAACKQPDMATLCSAFVSLNTVASEDIEDVGDDNTEDTSDDNLSEDDENSSEDEIVAQVIAEFEEDESSDDEDDDSEDDENSEDEDNDGEKSPSNMKEVKFPTSASVASATQLRGLRNKLSMYGTPESRQKAKELGKSLKTA